MGAPGIHHQLLITEAEVKRTLASQGAMQANLLYAAFPIPTFSRTTAVEQKPWEAGKFLDFSLDPLE